MPHPRNIGMARSPKIGRLSDPRKIWMPTLAKLEGFQPSQNRM
jgi:hypothetical protein